MTFTALAALDCAVRHFRETLAAVGVHDWDGPTPCSEWDVRYLAAHVVGGNRFASLILVGISAEEAVQAVMGVPQLGDDPLAAFDESAGSQRAAFHAPGALERVVSHPVGDVTGERFLDMRVFDVALHAWDLAESLGRQAALDELLVERVLETVRSGPSGMGFGIVPCPDAAPSATGMRLLLDMTGRCAST